MAGCVTSANNYRNLTSDSVCLILYAMFAGSERAGCRAAAIQSLLATAKLNGLEPLAWLTTTLEKLPTWPNKRIDELLPLRSFFAQQA
jgi:hypothetical protein